MSSKIGVQNIAHTNGTNAMTVSSGGVVTFTNPPVGDNVGKILQVKFLQYTDTVASISVPANTDTVVTQLTLNITPKSSSSIIRLDTHIFHEWGRNDAPAEATWFFYRDTTKLAAPAAGGRMTGISMSLLSFHNDATSTPEIAHYSYFDAPNTTSQITYKVGVKNHYATAFSLNRTVNDSNGTQSERGISFISATEIGG